jgi:lysophosphatidylcholine acyltransferase/lyso-PAF acetyltransferase
LRLITQFVQHLEIEYLPVYHPSEEEKQNPALYAENVRTLMAKTLGVPKTDVGIDDYIVVKEV